VTVDKFRNGSLVSANCLLCVWHCWLCIRKSIQLVKKLSYEVLASLSVCSEVQMICIWSSWCHYHPIVCCFIKIQIGLTLLMPAYPGCPGKEVVKLVSVVRSHRRCWELARSDALASDSCWRERKKPSFISAWSLSLHALRPTKSRSYWVQFTLGLLHLCIHS